jgi:hypothetical protein
VIGRKANDIIIIIISKGKLTYVWLTPHPQQPLRSRAILSFIIDNVPLSHCPTVPRLWRSTSLRDSSTLLIYQTRPNPTPQFFLNPVVVPRFPREFPIQISMGTWPGRRVGNRSRSRRGVKQPVAVRLEIYFYFYFYFISCNSKL